MRINLGTSTAAPAGIALLSLLFFLDNNARWLGLIGLIPIATVVLSYCPIYDVFRINTCKKLGC